MKLNETEFSTEYQTNYFNARSSLVLWETNLFYAKIIAINSNFVDYVY